MLDELLIALAALVVALWLGARASPRARLLLCGSALLVSAALFLPLTLLDSLVPRPLMHGLVAIAHALHSDVPELAHVLIFGWLAIALWTLRPDLRGWRTVAVLVVLAVSSELMQALTVDRTPGLVDVGADLLAASVGLALAIAVPALLRRWRRPQAAS
jgi:VanZ family protein